MLTVIHVEQPDEWQLTLEKIGNFDFYHTADYHRISCNSEIEEAILIRFEHNDFLLAIPFILRKIEYYPFAKDLTSVYGYAGPLFNDVFFTNEIRLRFWEEFKVWLIQEGIVSVFSRLHPMMPLQLQLLDQSTVHRISKTISMDLTKSKEEVCSFYRSSLRYDIRKLRKDNFTCEWLCDENALELFINIYEENMRRVNASPMYFFSKEYYSGIFHSSQAECRILGVKYEDVVVAASMFVKTRNGVQYHLSGTKNEFLKRSPVKLILDEAHSYYSGIGMQWLHLGGGVGGSSDSLFHFKAAFSPNRHEFAVWKQIIDGDMYEKLVFDKLGKSPRDINSGFFPLYRS